MKKYNCFFLLVLSLLFITACENNEDTTNLLPSCIITNPKNGEEVIKGPKYIIFVDSQDADGDVAEVNLYIDDVEVALTNNVPYYYTWQTEDKEVGSYKLKAIAVDNNGGTTTHEIDIALVEMLPEAAFVADNTNIKPGESVAFTDQSLYDPISWSWDFGDGDTSILHNPTHIFKRPGAYTVSLTSTKNIGSNTETKVDYITVTQRDIVYGSVTDIDGNTYKTVTIGTQEWMAENLKVTRYSDGTPITLTTDNTVWGTPINHYFEHHYCFYNNDESLGYGALYTYGAATNGVDGGWDTHVQGVCPDGWHVPNAREWRDFKTAVGNDGHSGTEGNALKSFDGWNDDGNGIDYYGFAALPGGHRHRDGFIYEGDRASWWLSTHDFSKANYGMIRSSYASIYNSNADEIYGMSVRCIKD